VPRVSETELLAMAAAAEAASEHPLGRAVINAAWDRGLAIPEACGFASETGQGVTATVNGDRVTAGKPNWVASAVGTALAEVYQRREQMESSAQTVIAVTRGGRLLGLIGVADQVKPDAAETVARLRRQGIEPVMLTGDNHRTAAAVAASVGISDFRAGLLPADKADVIRDLQAQGHRVVMAGDGINDAPALAQADIGIAMGAGTDIAIESADIVLTGNRLSAVADARDIAVGSFRKTKENLAVAFSFNGVGVPLAVTGLLAPVWAMIAMIASVSAVLANSFGTRLRPSSLLTLGRWTGKAARDLIVLLRPPGLASLLCRAESVGYLVLVAAAIGAGYAWQLRP
jgi:Cu+-exporting ATPase